jgi:hypothetical protein
MANQLRRLFSSTIDQRTVLECDQLIIHKTREQFNDGSMKATFGQDTAMPIDDFHRVTQTTDQLHITLEDPLVIKLSPS